MKRGTGTPTRRFVSAVLVVGLLAALVCLPSSAAGGKKDTKKSAKDLPVRWYVWLEEEVYPLITKEQRRAFLDLETEAQRTVLTALGCHLGQGFLFAKAAPAATIEDDYDLRERGEALSV